MKDQKEVVYYLETGNTITHEETVRTRKIEVAVLEDHRRVRLVISRSAFPILSLKIRIKA
jgi:hypothetical protein